MESHGVSLKLKPVTLVRQQRQMLRLVSAIPRQPPVVAVNSVKQHRGRLRLRRGTTHRNTMKQFESSQVVTESTRQLDEVWFALIGLVKLQQENALRPRHATTDQVSRCS